MARFQSFKRIIQENFDEKDRPLINKLAYSLNIFAEDVLNGLNNNLSINDNLSLNQKTITVTVDGSGIPTTPTVITSGLSSTCRGIQVINAVNNTNVGHTPSGTPFIIFSDNSGQITIKNITNLTASEVYVLTIVLYP